MSTITKIPELLDELRRSFNLLEEANRTSFTTHPVELEGLSCPPGVCIDDALDSSLQDPLHDADLAEILAEKRSQWAQEARLAESKQVTETLITNKGWWPYFEKDQDGNAIAYIIESSGVDDRGYRPAPLTLEAIGGQAIYLYSDPESKVGLRRALRDSYEARDRSSAQVCRVYRVTFTPPHTIVITARSGSFFKYPDSNQWRDVFSLLTMKGRKANGYGVGLFVQPSSSDREHSVEAILTGPRRHVTAVTLHRDVKVELLTTDYVPLEPDSITVTTF